VLAALAFLTVLGRPRPPDPHAAPWFPVAGAFIGALVGLSWWGAGRIFPPLLAAAVAVTVDLAITGMLHLDGLADAADGLLPHLSRERRLLVMRQPDVGAFGVGVVGATLLLRVSALAGVPAERGWRQVALLAGIWCASRTVMAVTMTLAPYARPTGLPSAFGGSSALPVVLAGVLLAVAGTALARPIGGPVALLFGVAAGAGVVLLARHRLGGFTGDVLGAAGMVTETVALVAVVAHR
jgi:adenosylcobinamide-GDP ribazoletransferase